MSGVPESLTDASSVGRYLYDRGYRVMVTGGVVAVFADVGDFSASINVQLRGSVVRVIIGMPVRFEPEQRELFAVAVQELNRRGLGVGVVLTSSGAVVVAQVPIGAGELTAEPLERTIALAIEHGAAAVPVLRRAEATRVVRP